MMRKWLGIAGMIILLDQITKYIAVSQLELFKPVAVMPMFNFTLIYNKGAAFSFLNEAGGWQRWFFTIIAIIIITVLVLWLRKLDNRCLWKGIALSLVLGGAVGNLIDRISLGHVIDFIQVYYKVYYWPAFNLADSAITVGVVMLIIENIVPALRKRDQCNI